MVLFLMIMLKMKRPVIDPDNIDRILSESMVLYTVFEKSIQNTICKFVEIFYKKKYVNPYPHPLVGEKILVVVAANAALVGGAQKTDCFSSVKWIHFCGDKFPLDGQAWGVSSVRLDANLCLEESVSVIPGKNVIVHEFAHILDFKFGISGSVSVLNSGYHAFEDRVQSGKDGVMEDGFSSRIVSNTGSIDIGESVRHDEMEFFAYATEAFFTRPKMFLSAYPDLYRYFASIYDLDMASYPIDNDTAIA